MIKALRLALEALEKGTGWMEHQKAITSLRQAIAEAEKQKQPLFAELVASHEGLAEELKAMDVDDDRRLDTSPPQRQWVGLTDEDFSAINQSCLTKLQAAVSAESILKEKNT